MPNGMRNPLAREGSAQPAATGSPTAARSNLDRREASVRNAALIAIDKYVGSMRLLALEQHKRIARLSAERQPTRAAKQLLELLDEQAKHAAQCRDLVVRDP